jgi:hypothetical protein
LKKTVFVTVLVPFWNFGCRFSHKWPVANVGESGESSQNGLANVGESWQIGVMNVGESSESSQNCLANVDEYF